MEEVKKAPDDQPVKSISFWPSLPRDSQQGFGRTLQVCPTSRRRAQKPTGADNNLQGKRLASPNR